jgi:hypothetical protein
LLFTFVTTFVAVGFVLIGVARGLRVLSEVVLVGMADTSA